MNTMFPATRAEGLRRLHAFLPAAGRVYAQGRNADHGSDARENVSVLSPYLRHRLITEEEVVAAVIDHHGHMKSDKFVQEVMWRTYWKGWLEMRPAVWNRIVADRDADFLRAEHSGGLRKTLAQAEAGETGIDGFDDWARELVAHGYLHNHARMWFASIWIFTLRLPWTLGADFFMRHLLDADPASNTLSWRWVAGLQTAGKTYLATAENIARYTNGRFAPQGLATVAAPLTESPIPAAAPIPPVDTRLDGPALLLITDDDLAPELYVSADVVSTVVARRSDQPGVWPKGEPAATFKAAAAQDAATRAQAKYGQAAVTDTLDAAAIIAAAREAGATQVVTSYAPTGPTAAALRTITPDLAAAGVPLVQHRHAWDDRFWPHATKGYFAFKQRRPELLKTSSR